MNSSEKDYEDDDEVGGGGGDYGGDDGNGHLYVDADDSVCTQIPLTSPLQQQRCSQQMLLTSP